MRTFLSSILVLLGLTAVTVPESVSAEASPEPGLTIAALRFSGDGCPMTGEVKTVGINVSDDLLAFTAILSRMVAETRGSEAASTTCDAEIDFLAPDGAVAELRAVHFRGFSQLSFDRKAELVATYSLDGERSRAFSHDLSVSESDYVFSDQVPVLLAELCGGLHTLRLHLELNISASTDATPGFIALDSVDSDRLVTRSFSIGACQAP